MVNFAGIFSTDPPPKTELNIAVDSLNESLTTQLNSIANSSSTTVILKQGMDLNFDGSNFQCDEFKVAQRIDAEVKLITSISAEQSQDIRDDITTKFDSSIDQKTSSSSDMGVVAASGSTTTNIKKTFKTIVETNLTNKQCNEIVNAFNVGQDMKLSMKGATLTGKICSFDQMIQLRLIAQTMITSVAKAAKANKQLQDLMEKVEQSSEAKAKGINEGIKTVANTVGDIAKSAIGAWVWIVGIVVVAGLGVAGLGYLLFKSSPALQEAAAGAIRKRAGSVVSGTGCTIEEITDEEEDEMTGPGNYGRLKPPVA
jgi:hypothetical protein